MPLLQGTDGAGDAAWVDTITGPTTFTGGVLVNESATLTATGPLTSATSGALYTCTAGGGVITITLPATAASPGVQYTFVLGTAAAANFVITSDGANMLGALAEGGSAVVAVNHTSVAFDGGSSVIGDHFTVRCDGTRWLVSGIGSNANSWILA
jgi:hypothetical protein